MSPGCAIRIDKPQLTETLAGPGIWPGETKLIAPAEQSHVKLSGLYCITENVAFY